MQPEKVKIVMREEIIYSPNKSSFIYISQQFCKVRHLQEQNQQKRLDISILPFKIMILRVSLRLTLQKQLHKLIIKNNLGVGMLQLARTKAKRQGIGQEIIFSIFQIIEGMLRLRIVDKVLLLIKQNYNKPAFIIYIQKDSQDSLIQIKQELLP